MQVHVHATTNYKLILRGYLYSLPSLLIVVFDEFFDKADSPITAQTCCKRVHNVKNQTTSDLYVKFTGVQNSFHISKALIVKT